MINLKKDSCAINQELPKWFEIGIEEETHSIYEWEHQWEVQRTDTSFWNKKEEGHIFHCTIIRNRCISNLTGKVKDFFEIRGNYQPFPIKGKFESSFGLIFPWMKNSGWEMTHSRIVEYR